ncbi:MAG TPA: XisI protein [Blastocatellia bacterium]|nr:XisI protein [Blastocatellia bacterium]
MDTAADKLNKYRDIIERTLTDIALYIPRDEQAPHKTFFDRKSDNEDDERIHHFVIHLEIINGKVWVQADNTDLNVTKELERAGIPKNDIVLGFHPPDVRPYTEYAVA